MKLLLCVKCNQVFSLSYEPQSCKDGHGGGRYVDRLNTRIWGDPKVIIPLGFNNGSFIDALRAHMGDLHDEAFAAAMVQGRAGLKLL